MCSRNTVMCFKIMCSSSLHDVLVNEIGLKFENCAASPPLWIGITFAIFQSLGSCEVVSDFRKMRPRYLLHHSAYLFRKLFGISSGPLLFLVSSLSSRLKIPASAMSYWSTFVRCCSSIGGITLSSTVNTDRKKSLYALALTVFSSGRRCDAAVLVARK